MAATLLESLFPGLLQGSYTITSPRSPRYNCIAWAAGVNSDWWWPGSDPSKEYWPATVPRVETLTAFQAVFAELGYVVCDGEQLEAGFEKIALCANDQLAPKHGARQLPSGRWTSKLGALEDIEHGLRDLEGDEYGKVVVVMKRPLVS